MNPRSSPDAAAGPSPSAKENERCRPSKLVLGTPSSSSASGSDEESNVEPRLSAGTVSCPLEIESSDDEVTLLETKQSKGSPKQHPAAIIVNLLNDEQSNDVSPKTKKKRLSTSPTFRRKQKRKHENESGNAPASNKKTSKSNDKVVDLTGTTSTSTSSGVTTGTTSSKVLDLTDTGESNESPIKLGSFRRKKSLSKPTGQVRTNKQFLHPNVASGRYASSESSSEAKRPPAASTAELPLKSTVPKSVSQKSSPMKQSAPDATMAKPPPHSSHRKPSLTIPEATATKPPPTKPSPTKQSSLLSYAQPSPPPKKKPPPAAVNVARLPAKSNYDSDSSTDDWMSRGRWRRQISDQKKKKNRKPQATSAFARGILYGKDAHEVGAPKSTGKNGSGLPNERKKPPPPIADQKKSPAETVDLRSSDSEVDDDDDFIRRELAKFTKFTGALHAPFEATSRIEQEITEDSIVRSLQNVEEASNRQSVNVAATVDAPAADDNDDQDSIAQELLKFPEPKKVDPYSYEEFSDMCEDAMKLFGQQYGDFHQFQYDKFFRKFEKADETDAQTGAQYGRMLPPMTKELVEKIHPLEKGMIFADVGAGDGIVCLQVALTTGCEARGIELMANRNATAIQMHGIMLQLHRDITGRSHLETSDGMQQEHHIGRVDLRHGRFEDPVSREFLSEADLVLCNNFNEVFGERSRAKGSEYVLNDYLIGILCLMKEGAALVTLDKLKVQDEEVARDHRQQKGLTTTANDKASFFDLETFHYDDNSDNAGNLLTFRRTMKEFTVFKYTRNQAKATFLCATVGCPNAKKNVAIQAWQELDDGKVVLNKCKRCGSCSIASYRRDRNAVNRLDPNPNSNRY